MHGAGKLECDAKDPRCKPQGPLPSRSLPLLSFQWEVPPARRKSRLTLRRQALPVPGWLTRNVSRTKVRASRHRREQWGVSLHFVSQASSQQTRIQSTLSLYSRVVSCDACGMPLGSSKRGLVRPPWGCRADGGTIDSWTGIFLCIPYHRVAALPFVWNVKGGLRSLTLGLRCLVVPGSLRRTGG
jgi:hypothetical protein